MLGVFDDEGHFFKKEGGIKKVMHGKIYEILQRSIHLKVWEHVGHLKLLYIWEELEKVCSKYKDEKLNDGFWFIIPWIEAEDLRYKVFDDEGHFFIKKGWRK